MEFQLIIFEKTDLDIFDDLDVDIFGEYHLQNAYISHSSLEGDQHATNQVLPHFPPQQSAPVTLNNHKISLTFRATTDRYNTGREHSKSR